MKVLIDIPNIPKNDHQRWVLSHGGIVLDGLTNGEVFQRVFQNAEVDETNRGFAVVKLKATHNRELYTDSTAIWNSIWYGKWGE